MISGRRSGVTCPSKSVDAHHKRAGGPGVIAPNKCHRRQMTQDLRKLRRYRRRWNVERLFAWLLRFRRLVTRYEHHAQNFLGFCKLGCMAVLLRSV